MLETVSVNLVNQSFDTVQIEVVDEVCQRAVFEGQLLSNTGITVSLCPDRQQRGHMTVYDAAGRAHRYFNLLDETVYLP
ncbi:MAG TPA: hypothetical protein VLD59_16870, partial [Steroidobacteraceae bacterium]|nr:hypothetical protein [Steroidobacteraceae bacterium]